MKRIWSLSISFALLAAVPAAAHAQAAGGPGPGVHSPPASGGGAFWPPHRQRARGLMIGASFGVDGCTDHACDGLDAMVFFRLEALYRMFHFVAVGLQFGMPFFDPDSRSVDHAYNVFLGPEVRGILPLGPVDLWAGMTIGWIRAAGDGESCFGGVCAAGSYWADGFGLGWGFGGLFYIIPRVAIGLDFWLYKGIFDRQYWESDLGSGHSDVDNDDVGVTWMFGVTGVYFFPL